MASGGLFGRTGDPLRGLRAQYLPERDTDLALSSLVGQWGLVAGAGVVLAAIIVVWRLALASRGSRTPHGALVAGGLAILLGLETVVSVGGNLGLLPLAGVPFPLVSYGGTALVVHLAAIGVVLSVRQDGARRRLWAAPRWRNPRPRLVRLAAMALSVLLLSLRVLRMAAADHPGGGPPRGRAGADDPLHPAARSPRVRSPTGTTHRSP